MHVSWQSEVNDDTALSTRGSERREVRCRDDWRGRCGAGNHYIRCREGCDEVDTGGEAETEGEVAARPDGENTVMSSAPRSRRAATVVAAYCPVPTISTLVRDQSAIRLEASSSPSRTSERPAPPIAVWFFTSRDVLAAF